MSTKEKIVESAKNFLITNGFHNMNVSDISHEAGFGKGTFYTYFKSKNELIGYFANSILDDMITELEKLNYNSNQSETLFQIIEIIFENNRKNSEIIKALFHSYMGTSNLNEFDNMYKKFYSCIEKLLFEEYSKETLIKTQTVVGMIEYSAEQGYIFLNESDEHIKKRKAVVYDLSKNIQL